MLHVFVETNWVIDFVSPFQESPSARSLLDHALAGRLFLYIPGICLNEAQNKINLRKTEARVTADRIRNFLRAEAEKLPTEDKEIVLRTLDVYERRSAAEIADFETRLQVLFECPSIEVFALDDEMLRRSLELTGSSFAKLGPFDHSILAGVLVRAGRLKGAGSAIFCEKDSDLQPWNKDGSVKLWLQSIYHDVDLAVQDHFDVSELLAPFEDDST